MVRALLDLVPNAWWVWDWVGTVLLRLQAAGFDEAVLAASSVAKTQYGLPGWKRQKVYPDFVFGLVQRDGVQRSVLLETKGAHLAGSADTAYKRMLLERLEAAFRDERWSAVGRLALQGRDRQVVSCDLLPDPAWQGALEQRWFGEA